LALPVKIAVIAVLLLGCGGTNGALDRRPDGGSGGATVGTDARGRDVGGGDGTGGSNGTIDANGTAGADATAGTTGTAGVSGMGGAAGPGSAGTGWVGETCSVPLNVPAPACGAAACGNGTRDTCDAPGVLFCPPGKYKSTEQCDGADLGGDSCRLRGYGSGVLVCRADCSIDGDTCRECLPTGAALTICEDAPIAAPWPGTLDVAATDDIVGLVFSGLEDEDSDKSTLTFARLSPSLTLLSTTPLEDAAHSTVPLLRRSILQTTVVPSATGWIVATVGEPEIFVHALDAQGKDFGRVVIDRVAPNYFDLHPSVALAPRAGGGPLLVWGSEKAVRAALLTSDGRSASPPFDLPLDGRLATSRVSAVYAGDAFYVTFEVYDVTQIVPTFEGFSLIRVGTDGSATKVTDILPEGFATFPLLVAGANDLRLSYDGTAPGGVPGEDQAQLWRRLDSQGTFLSPAAVVGRLPDFLNPSPAVAIGDDTIVLLGGHDWHALGIARVANDGQIAKPASTIATTARGTIETYALARLGTDVVAAWIAGTARSGRIGLARFTP
jgi:hypothetical protein